MRGRTWTANGLLAKVENPAEAIPVPRLGAVWSALTLRRATVFGHRAVLSRSQGGPVERRSTHSLGPWERPIVWPGGFEAGARNHVPSSRPPLLRRSGDRRCGRWSGCPPPERAVPGVEPVYGSASPPAPPRPRIDSRSGAWHFGRTTEPLPPIERFPLDRGWAAQPPKNVESLMGRGNREWGRTQGRRSGPAR